LTSRVFSSTKLYSKPDPTSNFNADIFRIASRTADKNSNFDPVNAAEHAERMLIQMIKMYEQSEKKTAKPNIETFRIVLKAFSNLRRVVWTETSTNGKNVDRLDTPPEITVVQKMEDILNTLENFTKSNQNNDYDLHINTDVLNLILKAYAGCAFQQTSMKDCDGAFSYNEEALLPWQKDETLRGTYAERAEQVLLYMLNASSFNSTLTPNFQTYGYVVEALSKEQPSLKKMSAHKKPPNDHLAKRASRWISDLEKIYEEVCTNDQSVEGKHRRVVRRQLLWAYSDALDAWSRSASQQSGNIANDYMKRIEDISAEDVADVDRFMSEAEYMDVRVDDNSGNHGSYTQAGFHLFDGKDFFLQPDCALYPSDQSYISAILALSRSKDGWSAGRAHELLMNMLKLYDSGKWIKNRPSLMAFNCVINAYANSRRQGAAEKAESVLNLLESLYFDECKPQYNYLRPDVVSYNAVVTAWSRCREEAAVYRAEKIVKRMEKHANAVGGRYLPVEPDNYTFNSLIYAWTQSNVGVASAEQAEDILRIMIYKYDQGNKSFAPDQKIFCSVINAWARCGDDSIGLRNALELLDLMRELNNEGLKSLKPDGITLSAVMDAAVRSQDSNAFDIVFGILKEMIDGYQNGDKKIMPTVKTFSSVLQSLAKSQVPEKHLKAQNILKQMKDLNVEPNVYTYNYVINCAASVSNDDNLMEAFKIALAAFNSIRTTEEYKCDSFTYAFFFKACSILLPASMRLKVVKETFRLCVFEGRLNDQVLHWVKRSLNADEFREVAQIKTLKDVRHVNISDLSPEWSRNSNGRGTFEKTFGLNQ
jgi:hypothetical protein